MTNKNDSTDQTSTFNLTWFNRLMYEVHPLQHLFTDEAYQRWIERDHPKLRRRVDQGGLVIEAFGCLLVGRREGEEDRLPIVDGQRRYFMAQYAGWTHVPCLVFESEGRAHEARIFGLVNSKQARKSLAALELFKAAMCGGSEQHLAIANCFNRYGLQLAFEGEKSYPYVKSLSGEDLFRLEERDLLEKWCAIVRSVGERCTTAVDRRQVVLGYTTNTLAKFVLNVEGDLDIERLVDVCYRAMDSKFHNMLRGVDPSCMTGAARYGIIARRLMSLYNSKLSRRRRLVWGMDIDDA